jgi:signal transduction histidine kinase/tetratricopeptide (TPR) repeat protein
MNRLTFIALWVLLSMSSLAQLPNMDEMGQAKLRLKEAENQPKSWVNDTLQMFYLNKICRNYTLLTRIASDSGLYFAEKLYQKALATNNNANQLRALFYQSNFYLKKNLFTKSLEANLNTLKKCEESTKPCDEIWRINLRFGQIYYQIKEYEKAIPYIQKSIDYLERIPNLHPSLHLQLGECYRLSGISYQLIGRNDMAKTMFLNVVKQSELAKNDIQIAYAKSVMGDYYLDVEKNADEALKYLDEADAIFTKRGYWQGRASLFSSYVALYKIKKDPEKAEKYAKLMLQNAAESKSSNVRYQAFIDLSEISELQNKHDQALKYYRQAIVVRDSSQKAQKINDLGEIQKRFELEQMKIRFDIDKNLAQKQADAIRRTNQINLLLAQNEKQKLVQKGLELAKENLQKDIKITVINQQKNQEIKQLKINELAKNLLLENEKQKTLLLLVLLASVLSILAVGYSLFLRNKNKELINKNNEIQEALLKGQTIERKRVASELHDNVGSLLSAVRVSLLTLNRLKLPTHDQKVFSQIQQMVEGACNEVRLISHNLLPEELEKYGLQTALEKMFERLNFSTKIEFTLNDKGLREIEASHLLMNRKASFHIYSICLELINNILKHSEATDAALTFRKNGEIIELFMRDNGVGMNDEQKQNGLKNVMERVDDLSGKLDILSQAGEGTLVQISIPINQPIYAALQT